jgi:hypothetical protein
MKRHTKVAISSGRPPRNDDVRDATRKPDCNPPYTMVAPRMVGGDEPFD